MPSFGPVSALPISSAPQVVASAVSGGGGGANLGYPYGINWWRRKKRKRPVVTRESNAHTDSYSFRAGPAVG